MLHAKNTYLLSLSSDQCSLRRWGVWRGICQSCSGTVRSALKASHTKPLPPRPPCPEREALRWKRGCPVLPGGTGASEARPGHKALEVLGLGLPADRW